MSRFAVFFLLVISQILAVLLAWLGFKTLSKYFLGYFLILVSTGWIFGMGLIVFIRKKRFWDSEVDGGVEVEEQGDRSFWFITLGMVAAFFFPPLETLLFSAILSFDAWLVITGSGLVFLGAVLFIWARRTLKRNYSGHLSVKSGQALMQSGPYRFIRHPAYTGYLLMALGISLGYSSLAGLISTFVVLLPGLIYRINFEEKLLTIHFGEDYRRYQETTKRMIPGIW